LLTKNKITVCYHYYPSNSGVDKQNLIFFLKNGIYPDFDLYITYSGLLNIPQKKLPKAVYIKIKNSENRDWNGYRTAAQYFYMNPNYELYFFLNSGVKGPYIEKGNFWWHQFEELLTNKVKLVGTTIGMPMLEGILYPHVQSMFFCLNKDSLKFLFEQDFFNLDVEYSKKEMIRNFEIKMSTLILKNGWQINSILSKFRDIDYSKVNSSFNPTAINGDPYFPNAYFGKTLTPREVIFFKNSRFIKKNIWGKILNLTKPKLKSNAIFNF